MKPKPQTFDTAAQEVEHFMNMVHDTTPPHLHPILRQAFLGGMLAVVAKMGSMNGDEQRHVKWSKYARSVCVESEKACAIEGLVDPSPVLRRN